MSTDVRTLFDLLPEIYRIRDAKQRQAPLQSLLAVFQDYREALDENLDQLYDDAFIETCNDWAALYIGDLIGYRPLHGVSPKISSPRAEVANTIRYRRRKGTASMLEQLARDVTGWNARVVEFFEHLAWNQYMQHTRLSPPRGGTADLRDHDACERITYAGGSFDTTAHSVDVRRISGGDGRYNIPNVGIFLWRLNPYSVTKANAREVAAGHFTFNPTGIDAPLFNSPQTEDEITHLADEINVPGVLRRRVLYDELEARRQALANQTSSAGVFFEARPVFQVEFASDKDPVSPEEILICNLEDWHVPAASKQYERGDGSKVALPIRAAVDPLLGRLTFPAGAAIGEVMLNYTYGFSEAIGGGPYDRTSSLTTTADRAVDWQIGVSRSVPPVNNEMVQTLKEAVAAWNALPAGRFGVIAIADSRTYDENLTGADAVVIKEGSRLLFVAADWPLVDKPGFPGQKERVTGQFVPAEVRPHLVGDVSVIGTAPGNSSGAGDFLLNGILLEGALMVESGKLGSLQLSHCTLVPDKSLLLVDGSSPDADKKNRGLSVVVDHSICGPVTLPEPVVKLRMSDSVAGNGEQNDLNKTAIDAAETAVEIERCTILGGTNAGSFEGSDSIFTGPVQVRRKQNGCVRFSFLTLDSRAPRRYRCQPDLEIASQIEARETKLGAVLEPAGA